MYQDKKLVCKDCGNDFIFTVGEQEFFAERGFQNEPTRCRDCRSSRKNVTKQPKESFVAICADCGKEARVPFKPRDERPVYCSDCFVNHR